MSELELWIEKLGHMPTEDIRRLLHEEDCKGIFGLSDSCPLARFFQKKTGQTVHVSFSWTWQGQEKLDNPFTMKMFVRHFDNGEYPELDTQCSA